MSLAMLLDTFKHLSHEIDAEKHAIAGRVKQLAWDTKAKISALKGYTSGYNPGVYGGYNGYGNQHNAGYGNVGYGATRYGATANGYSGNFGYAVPAKGYLGYGDSAYDYGFGKDKKEGPHEGLYSALLFAQTEFKEPVAEPVKEEHHGGYTDVHTVVEEFSAALEAESDAFALFIDARRQALADQIAEKKEAFAAQVASELVDFDAEAEGAEKALAWLKAEKLAGFEAILNKKLHWMNAQIKELKWYFADRFV